MYQSGAQAGQEIDALGFFYFLPLYILLFKDSF